MPRPKQRSHSSHSPSGPHPHEQVLTTSVTARSPSAASSRAACGSHSASASPRSPHRPRTCRAGTSRSRQRRCWPSRSGARRERTSPDRRGGPPSSSPLRCARHREGGTCSAQKLWERGRACTGATSRPPPGTGSCSRRWRSIAAPSIHESASASAAVCSAPRGPAKIGEAVACPRWRLRERNGLEAARGDEGRLDDRGDEVGAGHGVTARRTPSFFFVRRVPVRDEAREHPVLAPARRDDRELGAKAARPTPSSTPPSGTSGGMTSQKRSQDPTAAVSFADRPRFGERGRCRSGRATWRAPRRSTRGTGTKPTRARRLRSLAMRRDSEEAPAM